jgi:hypothetical protein
LCHAKFFGCFFYFITHIFTSIDIIISFFYFFKKLNISSVQDKLKSNSKSQGVSVGFGTSGITSAGVRSANSRTTSKQTVQTSLTGETVNINVDEHTNLKAATIASVDTQGKDNNKLTLTTNTLNASSLNNTHNSNSKSLGVSIGSTVSLDYTNDKTNSKTKTLATIGSGDIQIANKEDSNTKMLNTDVANNEVNIYDVESHKGLSGKLDTRLLTENGRKEIAEDLKVSSFIGKALMEAATTDSTSFIGDKANGQTGVFQNIADKVALFDANKKFVNDPKNKIAKEILLNPDATPEQIKLATNQLHRYLAIEMNITPSEIKLILDKQYKGATSQETGESSIATNLHNNMGDLANTTINETSDLADLQRDQGINKTDNYVKNRDEYSKNFGDLGQELLETQYAQNGNSINNTTYNQTRTNLNKPEQLDKQIITNTQNFNKLDMSKIAHRQLKESEIKFLQSEEKVREYLLSRDNNSNPSQEDIQGARHELTQTAIALVDNNWAKVLGDTNQEAKEFLESNIDSIKNVTDIEKSNSADGLSNIANNEDNLNFYKENIHTGIKNNINAILNNEVQTSIEEFAKKAQKIKEQGYLETVTNIANNAKEYLTDTSLEKMTDDAKKAVENLVTDMQKGATQLNDTIGLSSSEIADVYSISTEEANAVKYTILAIASSSVTGIVKDTLKGGLDLSIEKKQTNTALHDKINKRTEQKEFEEKIGFQQERVMTGKKANEEGLQTYLSEKEGRKVENYQKEWNDDEIVKEGILPSNQKDGVISRVHNETEIPQGRYLADTKQLESQSKEDLTKSYALPPISTKEFTTDYNGQNDKKVLIGQTGKNEYGDGGKTQIVVKDKNDIDNDDFNSDTERKTKE